MAAKTVLSAAFHPMEDTSRKPSWLRAKLPTGPGYAAVRKLVEDTSLHTVCQSAQCPNLGECWSRGTATLMILGNICTRSCTFCAITTGRPTELDLGEPARVAEAVATMERLWGEIEDLETAHDLPSTSMPDGGMAWMVLRWASGERLDAVLRGQDIAAGDFVRRCKHHQIGRASCRERV